MSPTQSVHSINLDLLDAHVTANVPVLDDLERKFNDIDELASVCDPLFINVQHYTLITWRSFDQDMFALRELLSKYGHGKDIEMYRPFGQDRYLVYLANADGSVDFDCIAERSKEIAHQIDPDFYLSSVKGAPAENYRIAHELWLEDAVARTPIYTGTLYLSLEAQIFWVEFGVELSYREDLFPDGRVQLTFSVSGKLGAAMKGVDVSAGGELGVLVMHEFGSAQESNKFLDELLTETLDDGINIDAAASVLSSESSLKSTILSVGVYAAAEFDGPKWADVDADASVRVGYARDFVSDENIFYFGANAELEVEDVVGIDDLELHIGVDLEGEQRWRNNGDSYVDVEFSLSATVGPELELIRNLLPEVELSGGAAIAVRAHLELDDPTAVTAWEKLLNPFDGSVDLAGFLARADVTLQTSTVVETDFLDVDIDIGVASLEVESSAEVRATDRLWVKPPGRGFQEVAI